MHSVKILKHWNKYNPGEVAGFQDADRELLERLAHAGIIGPTDGEPAAESSADDAATDKPAKKT